MKREVKNSQSQSRVLKAAVEAFGERGYAGTSLNDICRENGISKGLLYHHFDSKDALFLLCVKVCFDELAQRLDKASLLEQTDAQACLQRYFDTRHQFFHDNKAYRRIFCDAVLQTPEHLRAKTAQLRYSLDNINRAFFEALLARLRLRKDVTPGEAVHFLFAFHEFFSGYLQKDLPSGTISDDLMVAHEVQGHRILDIILYGIAKGEE